MGQPRCGVGSALDIVSSIGITPDPVFWGKESLELGSRGFEEYVDGGAELAVNAARIGQKTYFLTLQAFEVT